MEDGRRDVETELTQQIEQLTKMDATYVAETYSIGGGTKPFADLRNEIDRVCKLASIVQSMPLDMMPLVTIRGLAQKAREVVNSLEQIKNFNPLHDRDTEGRRNSFLTTCEEFCGALAVFFSFSAARAIATQNDLAKNFAEVVQKHKDELRSNADESNKALIALRKTTSEAAASREADHFEEQAKTYKIASCCWLGLTIGTMCAIAGGLIYLYYHTPQATLSMPVLIQQIAAKVILLSLAFGLVVFFGRNYSTSRHNFIINKHRATALLTFQAFIAGTADPKTKDAVLIAAARSIFSPQNTGYLRKDAMQLGGPLVEILRSASGK